MSNHELIETLLNTFLQKEEVITIINNMEIPKGFNFLSPIIQIDVKKSDKKEIEMSITNNTNKGFVKYKETYRLK